MVGKGIEGVRIDNCEFNENTSDNEAGAMTIRSGNLIILENLKLNDNFA